MSSWPVSVRRAGRFEVSHPNARLCGPSLDMQRSEVGVFPDWRWEFAVRELRNTMACPKLQRGRRFGDYSTPRVDRHLATFAPRRFFCCLRFTGSGVARWPGFN